MADTITVFKGDGIGPEITDSVLRILDAAGADLNYEVFNVGAAEYEAHGEHCLLWQMRRSFQKSGLEGQGCILQQMEMCQPN